MRLLKRCFSKDKNKRVSKSIKMTLFYGDPDYFNQSAITLNGYEDFPEVWKPPVGSDNIIILYYVINFLFNLPYLYVAMKIIRQSNITFRLKSGFSVLFCFTKIFSNSFWVFTYFTGVGYFSDYDSIAARLFQMPFYLKTAGIFNFFNQITKVLVVFAAPFSKTIYYTSCLFYYLIIIFTSILFIILFLNIPRKYVFDLFNQNGRVFSVFLITYDVFISLDVFILSQLMIFTKIRDYFPPKYRKSMIVLIFMYSFAFITETILSKIPPPIIYLMPRISYHRYYNLIITICQQFFDLMILIIISIMSHPEYSETEKSDLHEMEKSITENMSIA